MKIVHKLILGSLAFAAVVWSVGLYAASTSREALQDAIKTSAMKLAADVMDEVDRAVHGRIGQLQIIAADPSVHEMLRASNSEFEAMADPRAYIEQRDREWRASAGLAPTGFMRSLIDNDLTKHLCSVILPIERGVGHAVIPELFVTNSFGANVAQTGRTSDYRQDDEAWWLRSRDAGLYVGDVQYDQSAGVRSVEICPRISDANGDLLGIMKAVCNIQSIGSVLEERASAGALGLSGQADVDLTLLTRDGEIVFSTHYGPSSWMSRPGLLEDVTTRCAQGVRAFQLGGEDTADMLVACAPSLGHQAYAGLGWTLVVEHQTEEILAPAIALRDHVLVTSTVVTLASLLVGILFSRRFSRRIVRLESAAARLGHGDLDARVKDDSSDEIGWLGRCFNEMARRLKGNAEILYQRTGHMSLLHRATVTAAEADSHDSALRLCLDMVCNTLHFPVGHVYMPADEGARELVPTELWFPDRPGAYASLRRQLDGARLAEGVGLPGRAVTTASPCWMIVGEGDDDPRRVAACREAGLGGALCIPIIVHGTTVAVLDLFMGEPVEPDDELFLVLRSLGRQMGRVFERKRAEVELRRAKEVAEAATDTKSAFLANMSHEIRTPLTAMLGFTDLLIDDEAHCAEHPDRPVCASKEERREHLEIVRSNGRHLLEIINDILDISKIEAGKLDTECIPCSPHGILTSVYNLTQRRAEAKELSLDFETLGTIPETIRSDPTRLKQILVNLVGNAIKFTEVGGVRVAVAFDPGSGAETDTAEAPPSPGPSLSANPHLCFEVTDSGVGMNAESAARLFRPFEQADRSTARYYGGTGLGLAISRSLAKLLGGDVILADTQLGIGSRFRVMIPTGPVEGVRRIEGLDVRSQGGLGPAAGSQAATLNDCTGCHVLLAEDSPDSQRLISVFLTKAGAKVTVVDNGLDAVDVALGAGKGRRRDDHGRAFDVVLMDIQMPVMDGFEATRRLRQRGYVGPIIALTADAMEGSRRRCIEAGCDDYATKPINRDALIALVHRYMAVEPHVVTS